MQCVLAALQWVWHAVTGHGAGFFALNSRVLPLGGIRAVLAMSARAQQGSCSPSTSIGEQRWLPAPEPVGAFRVPAILCHSQQRMEAPCSSHPASWCFSPENLAICEGNTHQGGHTFGKRGLLQAPRWGRAGWVTGEMCGSVRTVRCVTRWIFGVACVVPGGGLGDPCGFLAAWAALCLVRLPGGAEGPENAAPGCGRARPKHHWERQRCF